MEIYSRARKPFSLLCMFSFGICLKQYDDSFIRLHKSLSFPSFVLDIGLPILAVPVQEKTPTLFNLRLTSPPAKKPRPTSSLCLVSVTPSYWPGTPRSAHIQKTQ